MQYKMHQADRCLIAVLPKELIDMILWELYLDLFRKTKFEVKHGYRWSHNHDLGACAVVCKAWQDCATRYLFRNVQYSFSYGEFDPRYFYEPNGHKNVEWSRWNFTRSRDALRKGSRHPTKYLTDLIAFLRLHELACTSVRTLRLDAKHAIRSAQHTTNGDELASLLALLPNLKELHLINIRLAPSTDLIYNRRLDVLRITNVLGEGCCPHPSYDAARLLGCFGPVGRLKLCTPPRRSEGYWDDTAAPLSNAISLRPESLALDCRYDGLKSELHTQLLEYLVGQHDTLRSVRRVKFSRVNDDDATQEYVDTVAQVLEQMEDTLEHLEMHGNLAGYLPPLHFTALRNMQLDLEMRGEDPAQCCKEVDDIADFLDCCTVSPREGVVFAELKLRATIYAYELEESGEWQLWPSDDATRTLCDNGLDAAVLGFLTTARSPRCATVHYKVYSFGSVTDDLFHRIMAVMCPRMDKWAKRCTLSKSEL